MKAFIKEHLPWSVRESLRSLRQIYSQRKPPFSGIYESYGEIPKTAGYETKGWGRQGIRNVEKLMQLWRDPIPENLGFSKALLPVTASMVPSPSGLRILDFGGASGLDYANLIGQTGSNIIIKQYHVVDVASACNAGREVWAKHNEITFSTTLPEQGDFDIVYSYSAVHCVEKPLEVLERLASYNAKAILLCKHPIWTGQSFVRMQTNLGAGLQVAQWVLNLDEVKKHLPGYTLMFRGWHETSLNVDNFPREFRMGRATNLLFLRR